MKAEAKAQRTGATQIESTKVNNAAALVDAQDGVANDFDRQRLPSIIIGFRRRLA